MNRFIDGLGTIVRLELAQRIRSVAWLVLLIVVFALVGIVTLLLFLSLRAFGADDDASAAVYSSIIYFVLLVGTLVAPAMSGNAINGDRDAGTLATTQVTLVSTTQLVLGKFLAAWTVALTFLGASLPFLIIAVAFGGVGVGTMLASLALLVLELGVVSAVGVGLSGLLTRPLFSVVTTYLVVAALSVGTLIVFGLGSLALQTDVRVTVTDLDYERSVIDPDTGIPIDPVCTDPTTYTQPTPRSDLVWGFLAANPYIMLADASAGRYSDDGFPIDLFSSVASTARAAQLPVEPEREENYCQVEYFSGSGYPPGYQTPQEIVESTVPSWFVGLGIHLLLGGLLLAGAIRRTHTPAARLAAGSRVA